MNTFPNPELARQWRKRLDRFEDAGMTIADFCQAEGYSLASFYQWRKRLRQVHPETPGFVAVPVPEDAASLTSPKSFTIELPGGAVVRLDAAADRSLCQSVIAAVVDATGNITKETSPSRPVRRTPVRVLQSNPHLRQDLGLGPGRSIAVVQTARKRNL